MPNDYLHSRQAFADLLPTQTENLRATILCDIAASNVIPPRCI